MSFVLALLGGSLIAVAHQTEIRDWWVLRDYVPGARVAAIASNTTMTKTGRNIFYVYNPQIEAKEGFNKDCVIAEASIVLGCYDGHGIYVYEVTDPKLSGVQEVTAAHELLHAAYERMNEAERTRVNSLTQLALSKIKDARILKVVDAYRERDPNIVPNELHSILGTEVRNLSPELERHYAKYFVDRSKVVALSEGYEQVFNEIKDRVDRLDAELKLIKAQIDNSESNLARQASDVASRRSNLDKLSESKQTAAYNLAVPVYNQAVNSYNENLDTYKVLISEYNEKVAEHNSLTIQQNKLIDSLDSKAAEVQQ